MSLKRRSKRERSRENISRNNGCKLSQFDERHEYKPREGAELTPSEMNSKRLSPRHNRIKLSKVRAKERVLKTVREKEIIIYKGFPNKIISIFLIKNFGDQKAVGQYIQNAKKKRTVNRESRKTGFKSQGEIKTFSDKQKLIT